MVFNKNLWLHGKSGVKVSELAVGSTVFLNESGSPVEFYVAKHDYESGLNGAGRTLLVRKAVHSKKPWKSNGSNNNYSTSDLDTWFNGTYKALLDTEVQEAIATTTFDYVPSMNHSQSATISRAVFALSLTELGLSDSYAPELGSELPIASVLRGAGNQWTRTLDKSDYDTAFYMYSSTSYISMNVVNNAGARPCLTLPSTALFDQKTLLFKGVA